MADLPFVLQVIYVTAAAGVLLIRALPPLRHRLLAYGARSTPSVSDRPRTGDKEQTPSYTNVSLSVLDITAGLQVPHGWFVTFYVVSTFSCLFWASAIVMRGWLWQSIVTSVDLQASSMTVQQVLLTWTLFFLQSLRRCYESIVFRKESSSTMFIGHWLMGLAFYIGTSIAIWAEGIPQLQSSHIQLAHMQFQAPSVHSFVGILLFILASGFQHDCHAYLASLNGYKIPEHPAFSGLICPHYFAECLIYLSLATVAAPPDHILNRTLVTALVFVATNLGVTADGTRIWYGKRFGRAAIDGKYRMIPFIF